MNQENQFSAQQQKLEKSDSEKRNVIPTIHSQNQQFCKICGAPLDEGDLFCIQCGWKIDFSDEDKNSNQDEQKSEIKISSDWLNAAKRQQKTGLEEELKNRRKELEKFKQKDDELKKCSSKNSSSLTERKASLAESRMSLPESRMSLPERKVSLPERKVSLSGLTRQSFIHNFQNQSSGAKYFVHKDNEKTEYLIIKNVSGSKISGEIRTIFNDPGFANERFEGILEGNSLTFRIVQKDLHPAAGYKIAADISFSGIADEDKIAGTIERENGSTFITYVKC